MHAAMHAVPDPALIKGKGSSRYGLLPKGGPLCDEAGHVCVYKHVMVVVLIIHFCSVLMQATSLSPLLMCLTYHFIMLCHTLSLARPSLSAPAAPSPVASCITCS